MTEPAPENDATVVVAVQNEQPEDNGEATAAIVTSEIAAETAVTAVEASSAAVEVSTQASEQAATATDIATQAVEAANDARSSLAGLKEELDARDTRLMAMLEERFGPRQTDDKPKEVVVTNVQPANTGQGDNSGSGGSSGAGTDRPAYRHRFGRRDRS